MWASHFGPTHRKCDVLDDRATTILEDARFCKPEKQDPSAKSFIKLMGTASMVDW